MYFWDVASGKQRYRREARTVVESLADVSPDGRLMALLPWKRMIQLFDFKTGEFVDSYIDPDADFLSLRLRRTARRLQLASATAWCGSLKLLNSSKGAAGVTVGGQEQRPGGATARLARPRGHPESACHFVGRRAGGHMQDSLNVPNTSSPRRYSRKLASPCFFTMVSYWCRTMFHLASRERARCGIALLALIVVVASASLGYPNDPVSFQPYTVKTLGVQHLAFSKDESQVATFSGLSEVRVWRVKDQELLQIFTIDHPVLRNYRRLRGEFLDSGDLLVWRSASRSRRVGRCGSAA